MAIQEENGFHIPDSMTPPELGQQLAQLVWESFSDLFTGEQSLELLRRLGLADAGGEPKPKVAEEMLIYLLWAHTRGIQQAYAGSESGLARAALDELHRAVFEDLETNGVVRSELPIFEQRVADRYARYSQAAEQSDFTVGSAVIESVVGQAPSDPEAVRAMAERAIGIAAPVSDFYAEVQLVGGRGATH